MTSSNWPVCHLEDVCEGIYSGGTPNTQNSAFWDGGVPWLSSGETRNKFITKTDKTITTAGVNNSSTRMAKTGSIVIASAGQGHTRGQTSYLEMDTYINQSVVCLKPDASKVDALWLFYNLSNRYDEMRQMSDSFSSRGSLTTALLKKMKVSVPSREVQESASQALYAIDKKIELNRQMNETLEAMARALFKSWFVDFDPVRTKAEGRKPKGMDVKTAALFPSAFNAGGLPEGWVQASLEKVIDLNPESWSNANHPDIVEYVDLANTKWGVIENTQSFSWKEAPSRARRVLRPGDTIVGTVRPGNGSYSFISKDGLTGSTGFAVLRPRKAIYRELVYYVATAKECIERLAHLADGGAYPAVRPDVVASMKFVYADDKVIAAFSQRLSSLLDRAEVNKHENMVLASVRDALLPKLISGVIRISDVKQVVKEEVTGEVVAFPKAKKANSKATDQFKEAVLVAGIVRGWGNQQYPLGNFRLQKAAYLVHRKAEHDTHTSRHAAGPYNPDMKYRGGIGIAKRNGYVQEHTSSKGAKGLIAGSGVDAINGYMSRYDFGSALAWVLKEFKYKKNDDLELLTTVDDAAQGLRAGGKAVDADAIIDVIRNEPNWVKKLDKPFFSRANIEAALTELTRLFPEQVEA